MAEHLEDHYQEPPEGQLEELRVEQQVHFFQPGFYLPSNINKKSNYLWMQRLFFLRFYRFLKPKDESQMTVKLVLHKADSSTKRNKDEIR